MKRLFIITVAIVSFVLCTQPIFAAEPVGDNTFQLMANPSTGFDATGDGGTGDPSDYNYYYVGQPFVTTMEIQTEGATTANIVIDYNSDIVSASNLVNGTFFSSWAGQLIGPDIRGADLGSVYLTGLNIPVVESSGSGTFGRVTWTAQRPTAPAYSIANPVMLDINVGVIGGTGESNIALSGVDLLEDEEDFWFHIWADTVKPFAHSPSPANGATGVSVAQAYQFQLADTRNGAGDMTGVGTGVDTSEPPGLVTINDGSGATDVTAYDSFLCSGVWGTNNCVVTIQPPSATGIPGDTRIWDYDTQYTVAVSGFRDFASPSQSQMGDANGPNTMNPVVFTFRTQADTVAPRVVAESPARGSSGNSESTDVQFDVADRAFYPNGPSGSGVDPNSCSVTISSASFSTEVYSPGDPALTISSISYGYRFRVNPAQNFGQSEVITVTVAGCTDNEGNVMTADTYTFSTSDLLPPFVEELTPTEEDNLSSTSTAVSFHLRDTGVGVDLDSVLIFMNDQYYSADGGAGSVNMGAFTVSYGDSYTFFGGNSPSDASGVSGDVNDYLLTIDAIAPYIPGEGVPIVIFARDLAGNTMVPQVFAWSVGGAIACPEPASYCGAGTDLTGGLCVSSCEPAETITSTIVLTTTTDVFIPVEVVRTTTEEIVRTSTVYVTEFIERLTPTLSGANNAVQQQAREVVEIVDDPKVEETAKTTLAPVAAAATAASLGPALGFLNLMNYLRFLFLQPILLLGRKKRKKWGVVYNAATRMPVDLAVVRLINTNTEKLVQSRVTDRRGRFIFFVNEGSYRIDIQKKGFVFPSQTLKDEKEDGPYVDIYHGEPILVKEKGTAITANIPLDPGGLEKTPHRVIIEKVIRGIQFGVAALSIVLGLVSFIITPTFFVGLLFVLQVLLYLLFWRLSVSKKPKSWGIVYNAKTQQPVKRATIRLYTKEHDKLAAHQTTDNQGRYAFLVGPNEYYLKLEKEGYMSKRDDLTITRKTMDSIEKDIPLNPS